MNYINRITEIPSDVQILIPLFGDITVIYEEIMDGGSASDFVYPEVVNGGQASTSYTEVLTGGDAQSFESMDYSSTHYLTFRHTATRQYFSIPCKMIDKTDLDILLEVRFQQIPYVGQYHLALMEKDNPEPLYIGMVEIVNNRNPLPGFEYNKLFSQHEA